MKLKGTKYFTLLLIFTSILLLGLSCSKQRKSEKKQIILISIDALRGDHLSSYGYYRNTSPNLSKLIEDSDYFMNAYPNGCWTMPSHMSLLTGTLPSRHGINKDWSSIQIKKEYPSLNDSLKTMAEILKQHNSNTIKYAAALPKELGFAKGFGSINNIDPFVTADRLKMVLKDLEINKEKEFFLFIHTWMVHAPYTKSHFLEKDKIDEEKRNYIDNFREANIERSEDLASDFRVFLEENDLFNIEDCLALYDSGIHYVDLQIGEIINKTKQLGIYDNLMIIVVSDHGEHFNERYQDQFYGYHGGDFYEEFIRIPIIIKYPYSVKSKTLDYPVSLIDVFPTVLDYFNIDIPSYIQGVSLLKSDSKRKREYIISEAIASFGTEKKMIRVGDLKYIITMKDPSKRERVNWRSISQRMLFNLNDDPMEKDDLYKKPEFKNICFDLEKMLAQALIESANTEAPILKKGKLDEKTIEKLKALGYIK